MKSPRYPDRIESDQAKCRHLGRCALREVSSSGRRAHCAGRAFRRRLDLARELRRVGLRFGLFGRSLGYLFCLMVRA
jgi:hypothetical protein